MEGMKDSNKMWYLPGLALCTTLAAQVPAKHPGRICPPHVPRLRLPQDPPRALEGYPTSTGKAEARGFLKHYSFWTRGVLLVSNSLIPQVWGSGCGRGSLRGLPCPGSPPR